MTESEDGESEDGESEDGESEDGESEDGESEDGESEDGEFEDEEDYDHSKYEGKLLFEACKAGQQDTAVWLIENGITLPDLDEITKYGMPRVVIAFLDRHSDGRLNITRDNILSALRVDSENGDSIEVIDILMAAGGNEFLNGTELQNLIRWVFICRYIESTNHLFQIYLRDGFRPPATATLLLEGAVANIEALKAAIETFSKHFPRAPGPASDDETISHILNGLLHEAIFGYTPNMSRGEEIGYLLQKGAKLSPDDLDNLVRTNEVDLIDLLVSCGAPVTKGSSGRAHNLTPPIGTALSLESENLFVVALVWKSYASALRLLSHGADYYVKPEVRESLLYDEMRSAYKRAVRAKPCRKLYRYGAFLTLETRLQSPDWRQIFTKPVYKHSGKEFCLQMWALCFLILGKDFDKDLYTF
ncbi:hypothetical protein F5X99DRAFT_425840 [Biscogniauxia marginata]|nr:hypothetical protein F5X99DRAFT_425840 [Biscogniauxia marginata]